VRARILIVVAAMGIFGMSCGSNGNEGSQPPATTPVATTPAPTDESSGAVFDLTMQNTSFHPSCVVAKSTQSISIENKDGILHNFSITGTSVDVDVQPGSTFNGRPAGVAAGTYSFFCKYHRSVGMVGTIVVT
jgi:plastocyanin